MSTLGLGFRVQGLGFRRSTPGKRTEPKRPRELKPASTRPKTNETQEKNKQMGNSQTNPVRTTKSRGNTKERDNNVSFLVIYKKTS